MTKDEEARLLAGARKGEEPSFEALVRENQKLVYNLALKITGNPDDAMDISQEVFLKAYMGLGSFRGESRFSVWLYRLTQNACTDFFRKNRKVKIVSLAAEDETELDVPDGHPTPEEEAEKRDLQNSVRLAIDSMPSDKREILILREFSGMEYSEISKVLGINEGTVKSRLSRAREALAAALMESGTFSPAVPSNDMKGGRGNG